MARRREIEAEPDKLGQKNLEAAEDYQKYGFIGKLFRFGLSSKKCEEYGKPVDWINVKLEAYVDAGKAS
ncbi:hypothetical protein AB4Z32_10675 [Massilia sp. 2TAF26]|uniref:hypothetical protein n=1 Tax=Massilia sp. 2TAF26 TaxID=3233012 RepID=UPI003F9D336F